VCARSEVKASAPSEFFNQIIFLHQRRLYNFVIRPMREAIRNLLPDIHKSSLLFKHYVRGAAYMRVTNRPTVRLTRVFSCVRQPLGRARRSYTRGVGDRAVLGASYHAGRRRLGRYGHDEQDQEQATD
jgi:hypothetical protein